MTRKLEEDFVAEEVVMQEKMEAPPAPLSITSPDVTVHAPSSELEPDKSISVGSPKRLLLKIEEVGGKERKGKEKGAARISLSPKRKGGKPP